MADVFKSIHIMILVLTIILSLVMLTMGILVTQSTYAMFPMFSTYVWYAPLGIVTAGVTVLTLPLMLIVPLHRQGSWISMILFDLLWICWLWVSWLTSACGAVLMFSFDVNFFDHSSLAYRETQIMAVISFTNCFLLMFHNFYLFGLAMGQHRKGNISIWMADISDAKLPTSAPEQEVTTENAPRPGRPMNVDNHILLEPLRLNHGNSSTSAIQHAPGQGPTRPVHICTPDNAHLKPIPHSCCRCLRNPDFVPVAWKYVPPTPLGAQV